MKKIKVKIEVSARHIHLNKKDFEKLFGKGAALGALKPLSQPGEFASNEVLTIKTAKNQISGVRVLGPIRDYTQVEISKTDAYFLGVKAYARESGDISNTPGISLIGPKGEVKLKEGVVLAYRHIHASTEQADKLNLKHGKLVKVRIGGERSLLFENVMIKVRDNYDWNMHLDTDEANAAGVDMENNQGEVLI